MLKNYSCQKIKPFYFYKVLTYNRYPRNVSLTWITVFLYGNFGLFYHVKYKTYKMVFFYVTGVFYWWCFLIILDNPQRLSVWKHSLLCKREMEELQAINSDIIFDCRPFNCPLFYMFQYYTYPCIVLPSHLYVFGSLCIFEYIGEVSLFVSDLHPLNPLLFV